MEIEEHQEGVLKDLWVPVSGAIAQQRKVDTLANNVANANTPGFKRDQLTFREYLTRLDKGLTDIDLPNKEWSPQDFYHTYGAENAMVKVNGSYTDFSQGQLKPTNNPFDFGLQGPGFFEVLTPNGVRYTRKGSFTLNGRGTLVTNNGFPVLSKLPEGSLSGDAENIPAPQDRVIRIGNHRPTINLQGEVFAAGRKVSELSISEFKDPQALKKEGRSFFINTNPENLVASENVETAVHQGFSEQSNVNPISEMSELIKANRHFESIQKAIKSYDQISRKGVNNIANF